MALHWLGLWFTFRDQKGRSQSAKILGLVFWICPAVSLFSSFFTYAAATNTAFQPGSYLLLPICLLFIVIGNYMPKCTQNRTIGIKIKWTLQNEENWNATHRFGGKVWVIGGIVTMLTAFFGSFWLLMVILVAMVGLPTVYSYLYYRNHEKEGNDGN